MDVQVINAIASVMSAIAAMAGVVGLAFYVSYTRRMMNASEATLRASTRPLIIVQRASTDHSADFNETRATILIKNIGNGPAVMLAYYEGDLKDFEQFIPEPWTVEVDWLDIVQKDEVVAIPNLKLPAKGHAKLVVLACNDLAGNVYQTHYWLDGDLIDSAKAMMGYAEKPRDETSRFVLQSRKVLGMNRDFAQKNYRTF